MARRPTKHEQQAASLALIHKHLADIRKMGASSASITVDGCEVAANFKRKVRERQPAIGFAVDAPPEEYEDD